MVDNNSATINALLQYALPIDATLVTGSPETFISWAVTVRAKPPAFPDISGGELALVSMDVLRSYDSRITFADVVEGLAEVGVNGIAVTDDISKSAIMVAEERQIALIMLPNSRSLTSVERDINRLIVNQSAQLTQRAMDIQQQLTRLAAENRDLNSLLKIMAGAMAKPVVVHDDAGVLLEQVSPNARGRGPTGRTLLQNLPYGEFQAWLSSKTPMSQRAIVKTPIGFTIALQVEKRIAGYLSIVQESDVLDEFDRLTLSYGSDVCAIELAKSKAIASAIEQTRGDWVQMWLTGTPSDDDMLATRAQQAGFDTNSDYVVAIYRAMTESGVSLPMDSMISLVRDDMARRRLNGAVGQYVDVVVALYPLDENQNTLSRISAIIEEVREQLATRTPSGLASAGISHPQHKLGSLRGAYREAKDAVSIAHELGEYDVTTFYGELKLYQLLLALKAHSLDHLQRFYDDTLRPLVEHDNRKQSDLIRTLNGFFEANGNLARAAGDLDVHRNTLVYRLDKITELTGLDLNDADNRLILHLALKIQRALATLPHDLTPRTQLTHG
jgi:purine catabolism regulator